MATENTRTVVDEFVKEAMLTDFILFPTREHVLMHVFLVTGNGYHWGIGPDGFAIPIPILDGSEEIEVQHQILSFEEDCPELMRPGNYDEVFRARGISEEKIAEQNERSLARIKVNASFQNAVRNWTRDNIDAISAAQVSLIGIGLEKPSLYPSSKKYCLLGQAPNNCIQEDWKKVAVHFAKRILSRIRQEAMVHAGNTSEERANERAAVEKYCGRYIDVFDTCTEFLERFA